MWRPIAFLLSVGALWAVQATDPGNDLSDTCVINGRTFQRGDSLEDAFETRCGPWQEYPCFCNPDLDNQIECPYCGFATTTEDLLRCAKDGQEVTFIKLETGTGHRCTCDASDPTDPQPTCEEDRSVEQCTITLNDGSTVDRPAGALIGRESRCGATSEFPCYCNPNMAGQIDCPFCAHATDDGDLLCLEAGETDTFVALGGAERTCECYAPTTPSFPMRSTCDDIQRPPVLDPSAQCTFTNPGTGTNFTVQHGASLAQYDFLPGSACGARDDWPCYCNVGRPNQIECPYCEVEMPDGSYMCGSDLEVIDFPQGDGTTYGCQCQVPSDGSSWRTVCGNFPTPAPACVVALDDGTMASFDIDEEIDGKSGPCGSHHSFPYICNPSAANADDEDLEYPYCIFEAELSGTVCAKDGRSTTFTDERGVRKTCECKYTNSVTGAQSTCEDLPAPTDRPTSRPTQAPVLQTGDSANAILPTLQSLGFLFAVVGFLAENM